MNSKSALRFMVMEGVAIVPKFLHLSSTFCCCNPVATFSLCLPCGISVDRNIFVSGYDCGIPHLYEQTSLNQ